MTVLSVDGRVHRRVAQPPSCVAFELDGMDCIAKLTVRCAQSGVSSSARKSVSDGWPIILSSLKSMLETGEPLGVTSAEAANVRKKRRSRVCATTRPQTCGSWE